MRLIVLACRAMVTAMKLKPNAVIYCRVSDPGQVVNGHGLSSQETRCREYAKHKGYNVVMVFQEEGVTGAITDRPRMQAMLKFLQQHKKHETHIVIIDDISRLARDLKAHIKLRTMISDAGGKLESPSIEFGEDSDSRLVEHLLASVAAHQREKNAEQVKNRMRARMQNGYWTFYQPVGYRFERKPGYGKILVRDEPVATVVQQALEGFARGRFETLTEVKNFLAVHPDFPKEAYGCLHLTRLGEMLQRVLYTGHICYPPWGIPLQPAKHEALISYDTFTKIQERLKGNARAPTRKDIHPDFPLRGFVLCGGCDHPVTACWSAGRAGRYPYYICRNPGCPECKKSIKKQVMESEFEAMLKDLTPSPDLIPIVRTAVRAVWERRVETNDRFADDIGQQIKAVEKQVEQFLERIVATENATVITAYEAKIAKLEGEKAALMDRLLEHDEIPADFESCFQTAFAFLGNPQKLWHSGGLEEKRLVLKLAFKSQLAYTRNRGFQTAANALPFEVLAGFRGVKSEMVEDTGIEPATFCLQSRRSTN